MPWGMGHKELEGNSEIWAPYLRFLYEFAREYKPEMIVECGVYMGTATEHMALANPDGLVIGIDKDFHNAAYNVIRRQANVRYVHGNTLEVYEHVMMLSDDLPLELLFLDSEHDGITPQREFEIYESLMGGQCLVACDDIRYNTEMRVWWDNICCPKIELNYLHRALPGAAAYVESGFGVFIVER
jgi:predicted O-methyltransferase YrrM